jgi:hypothetical protein
MKIFIKAKPAARENSVVKISETEYEVSVKEPPIKGRANAAIIETLADYFSVSKSEVKIVLGFASKNKTITIGK